MLSSSPLQGIFHWIIYLSNQWYSQWTPTVYPPRKCSNELTPHPALLHHFTKKRKNVQCNGRENTFLWLWSFLINSKGDRGGILTSAKFSWTGNMIINTYTHLLFPYKFTRLKMSVYSIFSLCLSFPIHHHGVHAFIQRLLRKWYCRKYSLLTRGFCIFCNMPLPKMLLIYISSHRLVLLHVSPFL